jgi:hypothetical protein
VAAQRTRTLLGRRLSSVEHGHDHRLTLRFAGGGAIRTLSGEALSDWYVDDERRALRVDALVLCDATACPEREVGLLDERGVLRLERGGIVAGGGEVIDAVISGLAGLPLTAADGRDLLFGAILRTDQDGERYAERLVLAGQAATVVEPPGEGAPWVRDAGAEYRNAELHAALAPLMGRLVVAADRDDAGGLAIRFAEGGRIALGGSVETDHLWSAVDNDAGVGIAALADGRLLSHDASMNGQVPPETGVWGSLGLLRPLGASAPPAYGAKS